MKVTQTQRGFSVSTFEDSNGEICSVQDSSACRDEGMLWLGVDAVRPRMLRPAQGGWVDVPMPDDALVSGRMHLTQSKVKALLPLLAYFAEHGGLPREDRVLLPGVGCPCCRETENPCLDVVLDSDKHIDWEGRFERLKMLVEERGFLVAELFNEPRSSCCAAQIVRAVGARCTKCGKLV